MIEKPIQVGDLVQAVNPCCNTILGWTFTVEKIQYRGWGTTCPDCGHRMSGYLAAKADSPSQQGYFGCPVPFLKRIPPLSELESKPRRKKIEEPA